MISGCWDECWSMSSSDWKFTSSTSSLAAAVVVVGIIGVGEEERK